MYVLTVESRTDHDDDLAKLPRHPLRTHLGKIRSSRSKLPRHNEPSGLDSPPLKTQARPKSLVGCTKSPLHAAGTTQTATRVFKSENRGERRVVRARSLLTVFFLAAHTYAKVSSAYNALHQPPGKQAPKISVKKNKNK